MRTDSARGTMDFAPGISDPCASRERDGVGMPEHPRTLVDWPGKRVLAGR